MPSGFIYVLANPAMRDLVKIGKTTRSPSERAAELSAATGVAAPFIVVFEQLFVDCDRAEEFVHAELEQRGVRPGPNREFFRLTTNEAVRVILQAPGIVDGGVLPSDDEADDADLLSPESKDVADTDWLREVRNHPWDDIYAEAERTYWGVGDTIEDEAEALKLYKQAARLGSLHAFERIAKIYYSNKGVRPDFTKAMQYFREGTNRGNYFCHVEMAEFLIRNERYGDAEKAYRAFFAAYRACGGKTVADIDYENTASSRFFWAVRAYIESGFRYGWDLQIYEPMHQCADELLELMNDYLRDSNPRDSFYIPLRKARDWVSVNLLPRAVAPEPLRPQSVPSTPQIAPRPLTAPERAGEPEKPRRRWWQW